MTSRSYINVEIGNEREMCPFLRVNAKGHGGKSSRRAIHADATKFPADYIRGDI